jgi:hypothetical protein
VEILEAAGMRSDHVQHAKNDVVGIEMLLAHEVEIAAGAAAVRRPGIAARCVGLALRKGRPRLEGLPRQWAERVQMVAPALWQIGIDAGHALLGALMDVAVGDCQLADAGGSGVRVVAQRDVHGCLVLCGETGIASPMITAASIGAFKHTAAIGNRCRFGAWPISPDHA